MHERGSTRPTLLDPDAAAVRDDEPARDREPEPGAAAPAAMMERLEDALSLVRLDPRTLVFNAEHDVAASPTRRAAARACPAART